MDEQLAISEQRQGSVPIVAVRGEIDVATAPQFRDHLDHLIEGGNPSMVVDLGGVSFLDSTALGVLISTLKKCQAADGKLCLVVTDPRILKLFEITGLMDVFPMFGSVGRAVEAVK
jgi:anti-sigma B factor antagonist